MLRDAEPRRLTPAVRQRIGVAAAPLLLARYYALTAAVAVAALVVLPAVRWLEDREARAKERVYTHGAEALGEILEVEPGSDHDRNRLVRLEYNVDRGRIKTTVTGSPFARRGLAPGDRVRVLYDPATPTRCLIVDRAQASVIDAVFD